MLSGIEPYPLLHVPIEDELSVIQHNAPIAKLPNCVHVMADIENRAAFCSRYVTHLIEALLLKGHIPDCQHLVHDHDLAVEMRRDRKRQLDIHAGGIALDRRVDKLLKSTTVEII